MCWKYFQYFGNLKFGFSKTKQIQLPIWTGAIWNKRLAVESSFLLRLIGPGFLGVVFLSKFVFAVVFGVRARSILESTGLFCFVGVLILSDKALSLEKTGFILVWKKEILGGKKWRIICPDCIFCDFYFLCLEKIVSRLWDWALVTREEEWKAVRSRYI